MPGLFSFHRKFSQTGVDFLPTGVAVVEVSLSKGDAGSVRQSTFLPAAGQQQQVAALGRWVDQHQLEKVHCNCLLARHDVQLLQLEKPAVAADEMQQAVKWKVKDLISYDVEKAVVEIFELPHSPKTPKDFINAVVANEDTVQNYVDMIQHCGMSLQVLDVHELATKNYCQLCDNEQSTVMLLQLFDAEGLITIYHQGDLYVARDFKIGFLDIDAALNQDEATYDALLLELQRSMDYFESSYGLGQAQQMQVFPLTDSTSRMARYLQNYVNYDIEFVKVSGASDTSESVIDHRCFPAYCAALRGIS